jgi:AbrB family looped-hinge helix DNA binding protein
MGQKGRGKVLIKRGQSPGMRLFLFEDIVFVISNICILTYIVIKNKIIRLFRKLGIMETASVTSKGQLVIPARLRRQYGIKPGTKVRLIARGQEIIIQPITKEYIRSVCGLLKGNAPATAELLKDRARDKQREEGKFGKRSAR